MQCVRWVACGWAGDSDTYHNANKSDRPDVNHCVPFMGLSLNFSIVCNDTLFLLIQEPISLRLSSHQISHLLSSIWAQSTSPGNFPENYEAIAHTYSLILLFSRDKVLSELTQH